MKKNFFLLFFFFIIIAANAQKSISKASLLEQSNDHLLLQIGYDSWANKPDSINTKGFSRSLNAYYLFNFPFKTNSKISIALGAGVGSSNIYFDKTIVEVAGNTNMLRFRNVADTNNFKKYKLVTAYLEAPLELRYTANPKNSLNSFKAAIGVKVGTLLSAHTKGKNLLNKSGGTINSYTSKESSKRYFNNIRFNVIARIGYGAFSLFGSYQVNSFIKEGLGPDVRPYSFGLTISGL